MTSTTNDVLIQRVRKSDSSTVTFHITNIQSINVDVQVPVFRVAIPQAKSEEAIVEKIDGNTKTIAVSWVLKDEPAPMVEENSGVLRIPESGGTFTTIDTADNQLKCLFEYFESSSLLYYYRMMIRDENGNYIVNLDGEMADLSVSKDVSQPVTWNATIKFFVGIAAPSTG